MDNILKEVEQFADWAHGDQLRKYSPERYIVHPVRVMEMCKPYTSDAAVLSAALLHDVLEDTDVTKQELSQFLNKVMPDQADKTLKLVVELTDIYTKRAFPYLNRRKRKMREADRIQQTSGDAQLIKYADIIDNCPEISEKDPDFAKRFLKECRHLLTKMKKGESELREKAIAIVEQHLGKLVIHNDKTAESKKLKPH
jgi:guanosine-3',5'-bis(diphosphate) 3'-pyrophosphohydrolase